MASQCFIPQFILEPKSAKQAKLTEEQVELIQTSAGFPPNAVIRFPAANERMDWFCPGWVNFLYYPFKIGMKFPFSPLTRGFLEFVNLSPSQIMPQVWRILRALEVVREKYDIPFEFEDLGFTYELRTSGPGRFTVAMKDKKPRLIHKVDKANDRGWMHWYFFVLKDSLGSEGSFLEDNLHKEKKAISIPYGPKLEERTARIQAIPVEERWFVNLVAESPVSLEDSDQESETSKAGAGENADIYIPMQVVFPVGDSSQTVPKKCSYPATAAASSSSSRLVPSAHELLALDSKKKRASPRLASTPLKIPKVTMPVETKPNIPRPSEAKAAPDSKSLDVNLSLSSDFCRLQDVSLMRSEVHKLLLPSSLDVFKSLPPIGVLSASSVYAFQSMQASLAAAERVVLLERALDESRRKESTAHSLAEENAKLVQDLQREVSAQSAQISRLVNRTKALEAYGRKKKQEVTDAACYYVWQTRGDLMASFLAGESSNWNAEEDIATWKKVQEDMDPPVAEDGFDVGQSDGEADSQHA
ncbi:unnamed protein product [Cuscuta epithymum]|uniref:Transposase (Putative), gypsy type n=1 Tax=Cuscuta epithymum TaxID=186058 RepID=A0AAV0FVL1_9ASTE|nr:unnamed protein product [Cuscuta epithymum]